MTNRKINISDSSVFELLNEVLDKLTNTEKRIVHVLLSNYPMSGLETIANLAELSNVSSPSVLRFVRKLGFKGYTEFQASLRSELKALLSSPLKKESAEIDIGTASLDAAILRLTEAFNHNLNESMLHVPTREIMSVLNLLMDRNVRFHLIGGRLTNALALYFYTHLHAVRPNVIHIPCNSSVWPEYLIDMKEGDVLCIFDIRSYQLDIQEFANKAIDRKAEIILFTDQWLSPISKISQHVFPMRTNIPSKWDSVVSSVAMIEAIVAIYTQEKWSDEVESRIEMLKKLGSFI